MNVLIQQGSQTSRRVIWRRALALTNAGSARGSRAGAPVVRNGTIILLLFALSVLLQWASRAYSTEFGGYPDEPAHYVTGLLFKDLLAGHGGHSPAAFARSFYEHYPKVAIGHWPPVFYVIEALWMAAFGETRTSLLAMMAALSALVGFLLYRVARRHFGWPWALWIAALYVCLPDTQYLVAIVMTEVPLTLFSLLAVLRLGRYMDTGRRTDAVWFGIWASVAILTKGDGWCLALVPPLAMAIRRDWSPMRRLSFWIPAAIVAILCVPYTLLTLRFVHEGWTGTAGWRYVLYSVPEMSIWIVRNFGFVLLALAGCGLVWMLCRRNRASGEVACMAATLAAILVFQATVPAGIEARKLQMASPFILFFVAAGARWVSGILAKAWRSTTATAAAAALLASAAFAIWTFFIPPARAYGYRAVAQYLLSRPELRHSIFLISSANAGPAEGAFIAEVASHERRLGHYVVRATKLLAHATWNGRSYEQAYSTAAEMLNAVKRNADVLVLENGTWAEAWPFRPHNVLLAAVQQDGSEWERIYEYRDPASVSGAAIQVYRFRGARPAPAHPPDLDELLGKEAARMAE